MKKNAIPNKGLLAILFVLMLSVVGKTCAWAQSFTSGNLKYSVISAEDHTVGVTGYVDGISAAGDLVIPETVAYSGITYSVTRIRVSAFLNCSNLISVSIPRSVAVIEISAFQYCSSLTSIVIPNTVTRIGSHAFYGCSGLEQIVVEQGNPAYDSRDNCNAIVETSTNTLLSGCKNTIIPLSVTTIGKYAFGGCSSLTSITIPNAVTTIREYAFSYCSSLTSIVIPNSVIEIEVGTFSGCSGLEHIVVEQGNPVYDSRDNCNAIIETGTNTLISGCKNTIIPHSITIIGQYAFMDCSSLSSIIIPNSVIGISGFEFHSFMGCSGLQEIIVESGNPVYDSRENCNAIIHTSSNTLCLGCKNTIIPNSVTSIESFAFYGCAGLTSLTIPNSVTSIGSEAFYACTGLSSLTIGNSVTSIRSGAFRACTGLTSMVVMTRIPLTLVSSSGGGSIFLAVSKDIPVYVPCGSMGAYYAAEGWGAFTNYHEFSTTHDLLVEAEDPAHCQIVIDQQPLCTTGETVVRAIPGQGYHFVAWFENSIAMSTNPVYTFCLNNNKHLVAKVQYGTGTEEYQTTGFEVYPNPSQGQITIEGCGLLKVTNLLGKDILFKEIDGQTTLKLPQGVYLLTLGKGTRMVVVE